MSLKQFGWMVAAFVAASAVANNLETLAGGTFVGKALRGDLVRRS